MINREKLTMDMPNSIQTWNQLRATPRHFLIVPLYQQRQAAQQELRRNQQQVGAWFQCQPTHLFIGNGVSSSPVPLSSYTFMDETNGLTSLNNSKLNVSGGQQSNNNDKIYSTLTSMTTVKNNRVTVTATTTSATVTNVRAATTKSPRRHQKHRIDGRNSSNSSPTTSNNNGNSNSIVSKRTSWSLTSTNSDRADFSSNEDLATCPKEMPHVEFDEEDPGAIDDVNTSESECSPKIRRKQKKKSAGRHRRYKKTNASNDANDDNKENNGAVSKNKEVVVVPKQNDTERIMSELNRFRAITPPLRQHIKLNLPEYDLIQFLKHYLLSSNDLKSQGYPYRFGEKAGFFKKRFSAGMECFVPSASFDVNAREFVPRRSHNTERKSISSDSGQATGSSSSSQSADSDSGDSLPETKGFEIGEKKCVRCTREFYVNEFGEYLQSEKCSFHWGKMERSHPYSAGGGVYSCCSSTRYSKGCTTSEEHVWSGYLMGFNGPLDGFVETQQSEKIAEGDHDGVYALDCEMSYTGLGLEVTKVTLVGSDGQLAYEKFVRPAAKIIDYNTRFSGITKKDLSAKNGTVLTLAEVQEDLLKLISADTILIGHALENDLRVLKIIHNTIIDTSICFPHFNGPGFKHSLRTLTQQYLKRTIQDSDKGHSSFEDSRACLELMLWRVRKDFRAVLES